MSTKKKRSQSNTDESDRALVNDVKDSMDALIAAIKKASDAGLHIVVPNNMWIGDVGIYLPDIQITRRLL